MIFASLKELGARLMVCSQRPTTPKQVLVCLFVEDKEKLPAKLGEGYLRPGIQSTSLAR